MGTPYPGTIRQPDVENIYQLPKSRRKYDLRLIVQLMEISISSCVHAVTCCALGRFMLDHFHLWGSSWIIPPDAASIDKHAELIAAFMAGSLTGPAWYGTAIGGYFLYSKLVGRYPHLRGRIRIPAPFDLVFIWALYFVVLWTLLVIIGAILHPRFHYLTAGSVLAVYGFGGLLLLPPSLALALYIIKKRYLISRRIR